MADQNIHHYTLVKGSQNEELEEMVDEMEEFLCDVNRAAISDIHGAIIPSVCVYRQHGEETTPVACP